MTKMKMEDKFLEQVKHQLRYNKEFKKEIETYLNASIVYELRKANEIREIKKRPIVYAYYRVSTDLQDYENQKQGVINWCKYKKMKIDVEIKDEGISGSVSYKKRNLNELITNAKPGDWIIVSELSRLSRSMVDTFELVKILKEKKVNIYCVKENYEIKDDALSLMILSSFAFAAQVERERISQRTTEALKLKKEQGIKLGRRIGSLSNKLDKIKEKVLQDILDKKNKSQIAKENKCNYITIHRWLMRNDLINVNEKKSKKDVNRYSYNYDKIKELLESLTMKKGDANV